jgi:hypothetical protein
VSEDERHQRVYEAILDHRVTPDMLEHIEVCSDICRFAFHLTSLLSPAETPVISAGPVFDQIAEEITSGQKLLLGRYRLLGELGRGGQGRVFRAVDTLMDGRQVALKICRSPLEARLAQQVQHPNVCRVFGTQRDGNLYLIELELIEGPSLQERLGKLRPEETRSIFSRICAGVAAIHGAGVLHLDLNPRNILLRGGVDPMVTDLGFAAPQGGRWRGAAPGYTAPELLAGAAPTPRADVYALGVLLRQMTAGARAAPALQRVVARATSDDPAQRYADAAELRAAFEAPFRRRAAARRIVPIAALTLAAAGFSLQWATRCRHELGSEEIVDLSHVQVDDSNGTDALPHLRVFGISVPQEALVPPSGMPVRLRSEKSLYEGLATRGTTSNVFLTQVNTGPWRGESSFTLRFDNPLGGVRFNRPVLYAQTDSGVTHPRWSAHALDESGGEVAECHEAMIQGAAGCYRRACKEVSAFPCVLSASTCTTGIKSVRFDSDYRDETGHPFAGFQALLIERLTLIHWRGHP